MNSKQNNYFLLVQDLVMMIILNISGKKERELGWHNNEENKQYQKC